MSRIVTFGEIMTRFALPGFSRFVQGLPGALQTTFAGAEANSAVLISRLGGDVSFVTALPRHVIADACLENLQAYGVDTSRVVRTDTGRLGSFFVEAGVNQRAGQVVYDRDGASIAITPSDDYDWDHVFKDVVWFLTSGITPALSENAARLTEVAMREARQRGVSVAFDVNFRSKLWNWKPPLTPQQLASQTMPDLVALSDLLVCGEQDAIDFFGFDTQDPFESIAADFFSRYENLRWITCSRRGTLGESASPSSIPTYGGMLVDRDRVYRSPQGKAGYRVDRIVDRLGIGDAFIGALVLALSEGESGQAAIDYATAAGCFAHTVEGDYCHCSREELDRLIKSETFGRVDR